MLIFWMLFSEQTVSLTDQFVIDGDWGDFQRVQTLFAEKQLVIPCDKVTQFNNKNTFLSYVV